MKEILFFILGIIISILYFMHLFLQLLQIRKKINSPIFLTFPLRFFILSLLLGSLFFIYGPMAVYSVMGIVVGRFILIYLLKAK